MRRVAVGLMIVVFPATPLLAQTATTGAAPQQNGHVALDTVKFLAGGGLGLALHESGHLVFDAAFDAQPHLSHVHLGPLPFFAIAHRGDLSPRREFVVSSAGFWMQEGTNEWLLMRRRALRREHAPAAKGLFAFNVLNSVGYALVAFAKAGPAERDTRGIADSIRVDERAVAAIVLAPAVLDTCRYFKPDARWAAWTSRVAKAVSVALVLEHR